MEFYKFLARLLHLTWILHYGFCKVQLPKEVVIGALFSEEDYDKTGQISFGIAVDYVNSRSDLLPHTRLTYIMNQTQSSGAFDNIRQTCTLVQEGVAAIIGPATTTAVKAVSPILSALHIPSITPFASDPTLSISMEEYPYLFKMSAPDKFQGMALLDIVHHFGWTRIGIMASATDYGRNGLADLQTEALKNGWILTGVMHFYPYSNMTGSDIRPLLVELKNKGTRVILLNCLAKFARIIFSEADRLGMMEAGWAWIVTDGVTALDTVYDTCTDVPAHMIGVLGTRPSFKGGTLHEDMIAAWRNTTDKPFKGEMYTMRVFDAVLAASQGIHDYLEAGHVLHPYHVTENACQGQDVEPWKDGELLRHYISQISANGVTGYLNFTDMFFPAVDIQYDVINLRSRGWEEVGSWVYHDGNQTLTIDGPVRFTRNTVSVPKDASVDMRNITLHVVTLLEAPFVMLDEDPEAPLPLKGFCVDMLKQLQKSLGFTFEMHLVPDGSYGVEDPATGKWGGLVGELLDQKADLVVAPLTISYEREQAVDFTKPFLDLGLLILMAKETPTHHFLSFLEPFSWSLWLAVGGAFVLCGCANTLVSWLSPYGNRGRYASRLEPDNQQGKGERNVFNLWRSLWYSYSQWMMQGADVSPRGLSGRLVYGMWYFTVMVVSATYTANLAAFLTVQRLDSGISSLDDLANQKEIKYGTVVDSATEKFFETQSSNPYMMVYNFMQQERTYVSNTSVGIDKVNSSYGKPKNERFSFIFDSTLLEYVSSQKPCQVETIGRVFNQFGYGLALQKNSPYIEMFSLEILKLRQDGFLQTLRSKWVTSGTCNTASDDSSSSTKADKATLSQMLGVFVFMIAGIGVALIVTMLEFCVAASHDTKIQNKTQSEKKLTFSGACGRRCSAICKDIRDNVSTCLGCHDSCDEDDPDVTTVPIQYVLAGTKPSSSGANAGEGRFGSPTEVVMGDVVLAQKPGYFNGFNTHIP